MEEVPCFIGSRYRDRPWWLVGMEVRFRMTLGDLANTVYGSGPPYRIQHPTLPRKYKDRLSSLFNHFKSVLSFRSLVFSLFNHFKPALPLLSLVLSLLSPDGAGLRIVWQQPMREDTASSHLPSRWWAGDNRVAHDRLVSAPWQGPVPRHHRVKAHGTEQCPLTAASFF